MDSKTYKKLASRTAANVWHLKSETQQQVHYAIGICTEVGEIVEDIVDGHPIDFINLSSEVGDVVWYLSGFEREFDFELGNIKSMPRIRDLKDLTLVDTILELSIYSNSLLDIYKKHIFYGRVIDKNEIKTHCAVIYLQLLKILEISGHTMEEVRVVNIDKLKTRFPDKFTEERANNRNLNKEREILENAQS